MLYMTRFPSFQRQSNRTLHIYTIFCLSNYSLVGICDSSTTYIQCFKDLFSVHHYTYLELRFRFCFFFFSVLLLIFFCGTSMPSIVVGPFYLLTEVPQELQFLYILTIICCLSSVAMVIVVLLLVLVILEKGSLLRPHFLREDLQDLTVLALPQPSRHCACRYAQLHLVKLMVVWLFIYL